MKYFHLIWAALFRRKTRTMLTLLSVMAAFLLFGLLDGVRVAFNSGSDAAGVDRMVVSSKYSIIQGLPQSLVPRIRNVPGVENLTWANWFGGYYKDRKNQMFNIAIDPNYFEIYPELVVPPEQLEAFRKTRTGALVGETLANRWGWKIGRQGAGDRCDLPKQGDRRHELEFRCGRHFQGEGREAARGGAAAVVSLGLFRRSQQLRSA